MFVALQVGLVVVIVVKMPGLRDPLYWDRAETLIRRTANAPPRPLIVALGTSRTAEGFDARLIEERLHSAGHDVLVHNFGVAGAGPITRLIYLRRLLNAGLRPNLLLIEVFPPTLNANVPVFELTRLTGSRLSADELPLPTRFGVVAEDLTADWRWSWLLPWHAHRFVMLSRLSHRETATVDRWGRSLTRPLTAAREQQSREHTRREYAEIFANGYSLSEASCRAYREMLRLCRDQRIPTVLVWMPECGTFQSWYPRGAEVQIHDFLDNLASEFDVPLINARGWLPDEADFYDLNHLRSSSARRFSERLAEEQLSVLLDQRRSP
jgi:hypothetical protein